MTYIIQPGGRPTIPKAPGAALRYGVDVADVLTPGATLTGTPTATAPAGITVSSVSYTGTVVSALVSGGTAGGQGEQRVAIGHLGHSVFLIYAQRCLRCFEVRHGGPLFTSACS